VLKKEVWRWRLLVGWLEGTGRRAFIGREPRKISPWAKFNFSPPSGIRVAPMRRDFLFKLPHMGQLRCKGSSSSLHL